MMCEGGTGRTWNVLDKNDERRRKTDDAKMTSDNE